MSSRFFSNSEASASELLKNLEKCFFGTTQIVMLLATSSNIQPHSHVLPASKGLKVYNKRMIKICDCEGNGFIKRM